jgi:hypothetical protein
MEQSTAYLILILLPVVPWLLKLTLSYRIRYKTPKLNVDKFYKKRKSSFLRKFFYVEIKSYISQVLFWGNLLIGSLLLLCALVSALYIVLAMCRYVLSCFIIPTIAMYVTVGLIVMLLIIGTHELFDDKRN